MINNLKMGTEVSFYHKKGESFHGKESFLEVSIFPVSLCEFLGEIGVVDESQFGSSSKVPATSKKGFGS